MDSGHRFVGAAERPTSSMIVGSLTPLPLWRRTVPCAAELPATIVDRFPTLIGVDLSRAHKIARGAPGLREWGMQPGVRPNGCSPRG